MDFTITIPDLDGLISTLTSIGGSANKLINKAVVAGLLHVQAEARLRAPHRTGTLQRSILPEFGVLYGEVKVNEKYGLYIEQGTGIYGPENKMIEIRPRNKQALMWPGAAHPVKLVRQKGQQARPFFQPAIEASQGFIGDQFKVVFNAIAKAIVERSRI